MRESNGLVVRPWCRADAAALHAAVRSSMSELCGWLPWCHPDYGLEHAQTWVTHSEQAWARRAEFPLGIFSASDGEVLGGTGINHLVPAFRMGNLGYWVATPHCGRGVARIAAAMAADIGLRDLALTRIEIIVLTQNIGSQRVAEAIGAQREGIARNRLYLKGLPQDAIVYSLVPQGGNRAVPVLHDDVRCRPAVGTRGNDQNP